MQRTRPESVRLKNALEKKFGGLKRRSQTQKKDTAKVLKAKQSAHAKAKLEMQLKRIETFTRDADRYALVDLIDEKEEQRLKFIFIYLPTDAFMRVTVKNDREFTCGCMDFRHRSGRMRVNCKHILYILVRILKLPIDFAPDNVISDKEMFRASLLNVRFDFFHQTVNNPKLQVPEHRNFSTDDICPICYVDFSTDDKATLISCPTCRGVAHVSCAVTWIKNSRTSGCVYCRDKEINRYVKLRY